MGSNTQDPVDTSTSITSPPNHIRVLVVDDEPSNRMLLEELLVHEGYTALSASGGGEALKLLLLSDEPIDVVLLDLMMPDLSGMEVLEKLNEKGLIPEIAVMVITASTDREMMHKALDLGAIDYIVKPFDRRELMARLRSLTNMRALHNEIRSRDRRLDFLISTTETVLCVFNQGSPGAVTYVSDNVKKVLGYDRAVFLMPNFSISHIIHPDDVEEFKAHLLNARGLSTNVHKYRYRHGESSWRWLWFDVHLLPRANDEEMEFAVALTDVTDALSIRTGFTGTTPEAAQDVPQSEESFAHLRDSLHGLLNLMVTFTDHLDTYQLTEQQRGNAAQIARKSREILGLLPSSQESNEEISPDNEIGAKMSWWHD